MDLISDWWMAQLAAQDYFSRLQASGFSQLPFGQNDLVAAGFPASLAMSMTGSGGAGTLNGASTASSRSGGESKSNGRNKKDRKSNSNSNSGNSNSNAFKVRIVIIFYCDDPSVY